MTTVTCLEMLLMSCGIGTSILKHIMLVLLAHHLIGCFVDESHLVTEVKSLRFSLLLWIVQEVAKLVSYGLRPTHLIILVADRLMVIEELMLVLAMKMVVSQGSVVER